MSAPIKKNAHLWERHPQDFYVEPQWCSRRLFDVEAFKGTIHDPSCGFGRIVESAVKAGYKATGADIVARSCYVTELQNFLTDKTARDAIVSNPPYGVADKYAEHALKIAPKVALLLPTKWMNSARRGAWLEATPLARVWLLSPRPSMPPGPVIQSGEKAGNGTTDFSWFVWNYSHEGAPTIGFLRRDA